MAINTMAQFTAIYSTEAIQNIRYSFNAANVDEAINYCNYKFATPVSAIIQNDDTSCADSGKLVFLNGSKLQGTN